jgi:hypothetical protein
MFKCKLGNLSDIKKKVVLFWQDYFQNRNFNVIYLFIYLFIYL